IPKDWGSPLEATVANADLVLQNVSGDAMIIIGRRDAPEIEHFGHWLRFSDQFTASVRQGLSEVRLIDRRLDFIHGKLAAVVEHTHLMRGKLRYSRKAALWADKTVIIVNFDCDYDVRDERLPIYEAFLAEFQLDDPAKGHIRDVEIDYIGEYRDPKRDII